MLTRAALVSGAGILTLVGLVATIPAAGAATRYPNMQTASTRVGQFQRPMLRPFITGCSANGPGSFVGGGVNNFAGGIDSGVLDGQSNEACYFYSAVLGGIANVADIGAQGSAIAAGSENYTNAAFDFVGGGERNMVTGADASITSGSDNNVPATYAAIDGGQNNSAVSNNSFIGGGGGNQISPLNGGLPNGGNFSAIVSGQNNQIIPTTPNGGEWGFIGGGENNSVTGQLADIVGGVKNSAKGAQSFVGAGSTNTASGIGAVVGGGLRNKASGNDSSIVGGSNNVASGFDSFAGGNGSVAQNDGTFVWSDDADPAMKLVSTANNQFDVRASGGVFLYSNGALTSGVMLNAGSGAWSSLSDRAAKSDVSPIDDQLILARVASLPVTEWSYTTEDGVRHIGPMAQDFYSAFGVGPDNRHITSIDEDGIALAAIKALSAQLKAKDVEISALRNRMSRTNGDLTELRGELATLKAAVNKLAGKQI